MFNNSRKKIQILQDELYIARLENASLRSRLARASKESVREVITKTTKPKKATNTKKEAK